MRMPPAAWISPSVMALVRALFRRLGGQFGRTSRKGVVALIDQAVFSGANFLTTVLVGRFCGLDELGVYALAFALVVFLMVIHESLVWTPYTVYCHRKASHEQPLYAGSALAMQGLFTMAGMVLLALAASVQPLGIGPAGLAAVLWVLVAVAPCYLLREFVRRWLLARLQVAAVLVLDVAVTVLQFAGFFVLWRTSLLSAATVFAAVGAACLIPSALWLLGARRRFRIRRAAVRGELRRHWSFGRWICASQITDAAHNYALHWLLALAVGTAATGVYAACSSIVLIFNPLILGIGSVLGPRAAQVYAEGGRTEVCRVVWKTTALLTAAMSVLCAGLVLFGEAALRLLYHGAEYAGHGPIITLLALATLAGTISFAADHGMRVLERPDLNFKVRSLGLGVTLLVAASLVGMWGVLAAAIGRLCGMSLASGVQCALFARLTRADPASADQRSGSRVETFADSGDPRVEPPKAGVESSGEPCAVEVGS